MRATAGGLGLFWLSWLLALGLPGVAHGAGKGLDGAVNLNTAPPEVLGLLPGIGPAKAESILAYRKRHPFRTVDELVRIKGIGRKMVRQLRVHLAVGGPTTATASPANAHGPLAPAVAPLHPVAAIRRPVAVACVPAVPRAARPSRAAPLRPSHGACPTPP